MTAENLTSLRLSRRFDASPERVFDAWLHPEFADKWLMTTPDSESHRTEMDARVGGKWTIVDSRDRVDYTAIGEYLEIDRPRLLVFTFGMPQFSPEFSRVTIEILPEKGGCILNLTHENVLPDYRSDTIKGWGKMFDSLASELNYGFPVDSRTVRFERVVPGPIERVWEYLVNSDKRGQWLATGEMPPRVGAEVELRIKHAGLSPHFAPAPEKFQKYEDGVSFPIRITRFEPPHILGITWPGENTQSEVLFELTKEGDKVRLILTHSRLADVAEMADVSGGWHTHLAVLVERLIGQTPLAFWKLFGDIESRYEKRLGV